MARSGINQRAKHCGLDLVCYRADRAAYFQRPNSVLIQQKVPLRGQLYQSKDPPIGKMFCVTLATLLHLWAVLDF